MVNNSHLTQPDQQDWTPDGVPSGLLTESFCLMEGQAPENNNWMVFKCGSWVLSLEIQRLVSYSESRIKLIRQKLYSAVNSCQSTTALPAKPAIHLGTDCTKYSNGFGLTVPGTIVTFFDGMHIELSTIGTICQNIEFSQSTTKYFHNPLI